LGYLHSADTNIADLSRENTQNFGRNNGWGTVTEKVYSSNIGETRRDSTMVTTKDQ